MNNSVVKNNEKTIHKFLIVIACLIFAVYSEKIIGRGLKITALYSLLCVAIITTGIVGIRSVLYKKDQSDFFDVQFIVQLSTRFVQLFVQPDLQSYGSCQQALYAPRDKHYNTSYQIPHRNNL